MHQLLKLIVAIQMRATDVRDKDRGATATEYALLVAFIAIAIIVGVTLFGAALNTFFGNLATRVGLF
jgi:pilus assembly protein Flp/PilA